jgi:PTH1 family peptidyl-tRNA hydrolase
LLKRNKIDLENLLIVCDDIDLEFGRFKIKGSGSSGGHRGLQSIIDYLGSQRFPRLRIGIGRPSSDIEISEYVLSSFIKEEKGLVKEIIKETAECCGVWCNEGISKSMGMFNRRSR